jgi:alpha-amylase/alpha-mannosidase (GH57 family)
MAEIALALFWHQHQPYYPDDIAQENPMPWVRLHGVKDYYGMALHLLEVPEMRCNINLVPSLLLQLTGYTERGASDRFLDVSRIPANSLSEADSLFLLDHFFMCNHREMIAPYMRYAELLHRRGAGRNTAQEALRRFNDKDLRDLQVWYNLTWIHPLAFERDSDLRELRDKGRNFTEADKEVVLAKQIDILRQVIPLHKKLADSGQVELTTTPFFHPILPLLFDKKLAREAIPEIKLPRYTGGYLEDAAVHVKRAVEYHTKMFGAPPKGMWPAEGSVCQPMLPLLAEHGIRWIATDEEVLGGSTQGFVSRDHKGYVRNPEHLYRPYKVSENGKELSIIFRDHALSDMIGFHYQHSDPVAAAEDFVNHLRAIGGAIENGRALVSVILDGENCWESYPGGGVPFLRALYERCARSHDVKPVTVANYLEHHPPRDTLPHLFAGSWINHNFAIWIGHEEDNTAWDALQRAREHLKQRSQQEHLQPDKLRQAWEEIYIAEGSDWFWWYGDDHSSAQDALFDFLFRKHLQNVYLLLGDTPPPDLAHPISKKGQRATYLLPRSFLDVKVDGKRTFLQWLGSGKYICQDERGTMAMVARGPIKEVYFGFNLKNLLIRVDFETQAKQALAGYDTFRVGFLEPAGYDVIVDRVPDGPPLGQAWLPPQFSHGGQPADPTGIEIGIQQILEISIPFASLGVTVDQPVHFFVELLESRQSRDRAPREGTINLSCPSPHFEQIMWDV